MAEKDIAEKTLESYNDVFADIVNGLLFNGEQIADMLRLPVEKVKELAEMSLVTA